MHGLLALLILLQWPGAHGAPPMSLDALSSIYDNNQAVSALKIKQITEAQKRLLNSLKENPRNDIARLNLGVSFVQLGDFEKALKEFKTVDSFASESEAKFLARYNIGRVLQEQKKVPEALTAYQKALEIKSDSIETKTNIELLLNQQGGGQGSGDSQKQPQDGENQNQGQGQDQPQPQGQNQNDQQKKQPQDLSQSDIEKILEELKSQEQKIRALEFGNKPKENENGKSW